MAEKLILSLIFTGLLVTACLLLAMSPLFWLFDLLDNSQDKQLRDEAQLIHLRNGSLGT